MLEGRRVAGDLMGAVSELQKEMNRRPPETPGGREEGCADADADAGEGERLRPHPATGGRVDGRPCKGGIAS